MCLYSVGNALDLPDIAKGFMFQAILSASVSVDTFFLLRYTLLCSSCLNV